MVYVEGVGVELFPGRACRLYLSCVYQCSNFTLPLNKLYGEAFGYMPADVAMHLRIGQSLVDANVDDSRHLLAMFRDYQYRMR